MDRQAVRSTIVVLALIALGGCSASATPTPPPASQQPVVTSGPTGAATAEATPALTPAPTATESPTPTRAPAHWITAGSMTRARLAFPLITLQDGRALAVGDGYVVCQGECGGLYTADQSAKHADLYDPSNNTWSATGGLNLDRSNYSTTLLENGQVLIAGGYASPPSVCFQSAKLYNPAKGAWTQATSLQKSDRCAPAGALMPDGRVLVMGGQNYKYKYLTSAEVFDPSAQTWSYVASMPGIRLDGQAVALGNGLILLTGGEDADSNPLSSTWLYDPTANKWLVAGSMAQAVGGHLVALADGSAVMVNGGHYDSVDDKWVAVPSERFDPTSSTWSKIADMGTSRGNPFVARLADGRILVAGGAVKVSMTTEGVRTTTLTKTAEIWDPATDTWTPTADMPDAREGGAATLLKDGSVLLAGGDLGEQGELFIPGGFPTKLIAAALRFYP